MHLDKLDMSSRTLSVLKSSLFSARLIAQQDFAAKNDVGSEKKTIVYI
jgi:hypothetical protein